MSDNDLVAIRKRLAATSGHEWVSYGQVLAQIHRSMSGAVSNETLAVFGQEADAEFAAYAKEDVDSLCDEVEKLRERVEAAELRIAESEDANA